MEDILETDKAKKTFEDLLVASHPLLYNHLLNLNVEPLSIAFPWIFSGFSQYLNVEELLLLWDRILAYDSLDLLPILATSIFLFRSELLLRHAKSADDVVEILYDGSRIKVVALLQIILFQNEL